ncbi:YbaN family protein [Thalassotalea sp. LPB0316]|uniref:YbaN family protein n=1 Tax=Thalassotalea sp. LPB0316 TaxID=2769490 RepID=UPI001867A39D|nr:YbaN family protein [Thalassotalea sp. LPB0316]QOL25567.1 YbaN family protein [Thalassotalea sp. LPB0316]
MKHAIPRWLYILLGLCFVLLAALGVVLPILPTTPFLIVAGACFAKSSPRLHQWLLDNPTFGPLIYHWQTTRSIPRRAKRIAIISIVLTCAWSCYILPNWYLKLLVIALVAWPIYFLANLPLAEDVGRFNPNRQTK